MQAIRIIISAVKAYYEEILFFFMTGAILCVATLLIIPMPFALVGVSMIAHRTIRGLGVNWGLYWGAVKEYGLRSVQLTLVLALGYGLLAANIWFYSTPGVSPIPDNVAVWILPIWFGIGLVWSAVTFYANAFLLELKEPKLLTILRSSLFLALLNPLPTLVLLIVTALLTAMSIAMPILLIALPGLIATLSVTSVHVLVTAAREKCGPTEKEGQSTD